MADIPTHVYWQLAVDAGDRELASDLLSRFANGDTDPSLLLYMRAMAEAFVEADTSGNKRLGDDMRRHAGLANKRRKHADIERKLSPLKWFDPTDSETGKSIQLSAAERNRRAMALLDDLIERVPDADRDGEREKLRRIVKEHLKR